MTIVHLVLRIRKRIDPIQEYKEYLEQQVRRQQEYTYQSQQVFGGNSYWDRGLGIVGASSLDGAQRPGGLK